MGEAPRRSEVMGPPGFGVERLVCHHAALAAAASTHAPVRTVPFKVELTRKDKNAERKPPRRKLSQVLGKKGFAFLAFEALANARLRVGTEGHQRQ